MVDIDPAMNQFASAKYAAAGLDVNIVQGDARDLDFQQDFDLLVCVNSVYAMGSSGAMLTTLRRWIDADGKLFIIDFGRKLNLMDWHFYLLKERVKELGIRETIRWYRSVSEAVKQNSKGAQAQESGSYWLHSPDQFAERLRESGWSIQEQGKCYRSYCDFAVCTPR